MLDVFDVVGLHQLFVAAIDDIITFRCENTEARNVRERVSAFDFALIATYDRTCNRVIRIALRDGGKTQNFVFVAFGFDCRDCKVSFCESTRFVEHKHVGSVEHFKIVRAFYEYALSRRRADAREERERHRNDKRARARNDKEGKSAINPRVPILCHRTADDCKQNRNADNGGSVVFRKFGDEVFSLGFLARSVLDKVKYFRNGRIIEYFCHLHFDLRRKIDATADDVFTFFEFSRERFSCQCFGVESGRSADDNAVKRNFFTGINHDDVTHLHFARVNLFDNVVFTFYVCIIGANVHKRGDRFSRLARCVTLEEFTDLIEQQNGATFIEAFLFKSRHTCVDTKSERTERGNAHKQVFVEHLSVNDVAPCPEQNVIADCDIHGKIQEERQQPSVLSAHRFCKSDDLIRDENHKKSRQRHANANEIFLFFS